MVDSLIDRFAGLYGANRAIRSEARFIVDCEDPSLDPFQQSNALFHGKREESYGLSQIFLPQHADITLEQAEDPEFSIEFLIKNLVAGNDDMWLHCSQKFKNLRVQYATE